MVVELVQRMALPQQQELLILVVEVAVDLQLDLQVIMMVMLVDQEL
tara:strand:+ start:275 stop:412 length:138 start_codon:yes stop_codon:yes gene_type:complete